MCSHSIFHNNIIHVHDIVHACAWKQKDSLRTTFGKLANISTRSSVHAIIEILIIITCGFLIKSICHN